jgi:chloride channel 7
LATPAATPIATPMSTRSVKWEKDIEDAAGALHRPLLYHGTNTTSQMAIVGANTCPIESLDYEYACMPLVFPHTLFLRYPYSYSAT